MNAVEVLRARFSFARVGFPRWGASESGASALARTAVGEGASTGCSRVETLWRRQVKAHGRVATVLEIGHRGEGHRSWMDEAVNYAGRDVVAGGIPQDLLAALRSLPDQSYDAVLSVDAIEHVKAPWRVADEIVRLLRPGGITFHSTVFTTRYQPQPEDFFRFTPDGLKSLFGDLECLTAEFDATERRRDGRSERGGDIFGGSREGWRVNYCGRKPFLR